jgi:chromate transporter
VSSHSSTVEDESSVGAATARVPRESLGKLFKRFLHFGCLAWGGPVAQIGMLRHAFVDEEKWVTSAQFNRVLALYQVLPGPEAHEMCVYFGMLSRGRLGGVLAGLGFMLPGFLLMFALSWAYVHFGLNMQGGFAPVFAAVQAAVAALIVRAVHRIGSHVLLDRWLWAIAILALLAHLWGVHFAVVLGAGGLLYALSRTHRSAGLVLASIAAIALAIWAYQRGFALASMEPQSVAATGQTKSVSILELFISGLKAGLLTFGGAYTVIPFLQRDAVSQGAWMTNNQFLDGLALSGLLPAPLIIFATFVGYLGGGAVGAIALTVGIFLPAFAFTLVAHDPLERLVHRPRIRTFLEGLTAAVVGLIAGTALSFMLISIDNVVGGLVFAAALVALFVWNKRWLVPAVIAAAAGVGFFVKVFS